MSRMRSSTCRRLIFPDDFLYRSLVYRKFDDTSIVVILLLRSISCSDQTKKNKKSLIWNSEWSELPIYIGFTLRYVFFCFPPVKIFRPVIFLRSSKLFSGNKLYQVCVRFAGDLSINIYIFLWTEFPLISILYF